MKLFAEYLKEREGTEIVECPQGFATYKINDNQTCYLQDIYVKPEFRQKGVASDLADLVTQHAKDAGCNRLLGSTDIQTKGATEGLQAQLAYGFKLHSLSGTVIVTSKDI